MESVQIEQANRAKLKLLSDKIYMMNTNAAQEANSKKQAAQSQIKALQFRITRDFNGVEYEAAVKAAREDLVVIKAELQRDQLALSAKHSTDVGNVRELKEILDSWISQQKIRQTQILKQREEQHDNKIENINQSSITASAESSVKIKESIRSISSQLLVLKKELQVEKQKREGSSQQIVSTIEQQIQKFKQLISEQSKSRREQQGRLNKMFEQLTTKLKNQAELERIRRQNIHKSMLSLVETACDKLERRLLK